MRLLVRHLYRAYPELDRFTDEQCLRFVRAANRGFWRTLGRVVLITVVSAALLVGGVVASAYVTSAFDRFESKRLGAPFWVDAMRVMATLPLMAVAPVGGFLARDLMLKRRLRYVLRSRSACPQCSYRLIGLAVTSDHKIKCPECGLVCDVDPSLSELAPDETGKEQYHPSVIAPPRPKFWTRRRRRVALWATAALILIPGTLVGGYELWVQHVAAEAMRARPGVAALMAVVERDLPPDAGKDNCWGSLIEASQIMDKSDHRVWGIGQIVFTDGQMVSPEPWSVISVSKLGPPPTPYDMACRDLAMRMLDEYRADGVDAQLRKVAASRLAVRPIADDPNPLGRKFPTDLGQIRRLQMYCLERVAVAQGAHDTAGVLDGVEWGMAISRFLRQQAFGVDTMFANLTDVAWYSRLRDVLNTHPDGATLDRIEQMLAAQESHVSVSHFLDCEELLAEDQVAWFFSDPNRFRFGRYSRAIQQQYGANATGPLGTLAANLDACKGLFAMARANAAMLPKDRAATIASYDTGGLALVMGSNLSLDYLVSLWDESRVAREALGVIVALERFRAESGGYPPGLEALVPRYVAAIPVDPWSGRPLCYKRVDAAKDVFGRGFLLYSVGADGTDDGGVEQGSDVPFGGQTSPGTDYILNQPKRGLGR